MDKRRMKAKQWLKETTDEEYQNFIAKAKLNRRQLEVLELVFKKGMFEYEASDELVVSYGTVKNICTIIYNRIEKLKLA